VKDGLISESDIDNALKKLMTIRFRLGMFDAPDAVKYQQIPYSENDTPAHHALSRQAARESIVLLKNNAKTLPLSKTLNSIAVIGPNADDRDVMLGNYNGEPSTWVTPLQGIKNAVSPGMRVLYSQGMYPTGVFFETVDGSALSSTNGRGLKGEYFNNRDLSGEPAAVQINPQIDFNWGSLSPARGVNEDAFSVRWTGKITPTESGKYTFGGRSNGPLRIWLDERLVVEETTNRRTRNVTKEVDLEAGRAYDLRVEYQELSNHYAQARLVWTPPSSQANLRADAIEKAKQADVVVMVMGISPSIEGEEMPVQLEGFRGGDRTDISLPKPQLQLIKDIHALGKPVVLVTMGGSALAMNWENDNIPAILHSWYPGQFGGAAIADVLFGDYNPAGRLPVTFYKSVDQLPRFDDYKMDGRTYRYFKGVPLYPFGYGLSYTTFGYSGLKAPSKIDAGKDVPVSVVVQNAGKNAGDEVVQLYVTNASAKLPVPIRSLAGATRVGLKPGERKTVSFTLTPRHLSTVLDDGKRVVEPGEYTFSVGGKQPGFSGSADAASTGVVNGKFTISGKPIELPK